MRLQAVLAALGLLACAQGTESADDVQTRIDTESSALRRVIDSLNAEYTQNFNQGHGDLFAAQFADDGELVVAGNPANSGRQAIATFVSGLGGFRPQLTLTTTRVVANGPLALERGTYTLGITPTGAPAPATEEGTYVVHWERSPGGAWLRVTDIATSPAPLPPPPPPAR